VLLAAGSLDVSDTRTDQNEIRGEVVTRTFLDGAVGRLPGFWETPRMIVRPATAADAIPIASLLDALLATTAIEWRDTPRTAEGISEWLAEHEVVLVADEGGEVVGVAAFGWFRDIVKRPGYRFTVEHTVHVRQRLWGSGVGAELMGVLMDVARDRGMHTMVAAVDGANEASIRFHRRLGFVEVARMPEIGAKFGRWQGLVLLQLRLDDRATPPES
jgi:phosphinothricin acetyltransferase